MTTLKTLLFLFTILSLLSCDRNLNNNGSCSENPGEDKLLVFVGEKIEVKEGDAEEGSMDAKFIAKYKVLEKVCGSYDKDTIEFVVYDHYGRPAFEEYKTVLLYVSKGKEYYYHQKYLYHDLYRTTNGRWASPYPSRDYESIDLAIIDIRPVKVEFSKPVFYSVAGLKRREIRMWYPEPYYRIEGDKAIAVYGNFVPELLELSKAGVLTARGLYGKQDHLDSVEPRELEILEEVKVPKADAKQLSAAWKELYNGISRQESYTIRAMALDSVVCSVCEGFSEPHFYNDYEPIDSFISASFRNIPGTELWRNMSNGRFELSATKYPKSRPETFLLPSKEQFIVYNVTFSVVNKFGDRKYEMYHRFEFVKVNGKFKFYGMSSGWTSSSG